MLQQAGVSAWPVTLRHVVADAAAAPQTRTKARGTQSACWASGTRVWPEGTATPLFCQSPAMRCETTAGSPP